MRLYCTITCMYLYQTYEHNHSMHSDIILVLVGCVVVHNDTYYSTIPLDLTFNYRYGVILRDLEMKDQACDALAKACSEVPLLWAAWQELYKLCDNREMVLVLIMKCLLPSFVSSCIA